MEMKGVGKERAMFGYATILIIDTLNILGSNRKNMN